MIALPTANQEARQSLETGARPWGADKSNLISEYQAGVSKPDDLNVKPHILNVSWVEWSLQCGAEVSGNIKA